MAEGGVAAAFGHVAEADSWKVHFRDTMVGGKLLNNPRMAELHATEAPDRVRELEAWGAVFDRTSDGRILQRPFGGPLARAAGTRRRPDRARDDPDAPGPGRLARHQGLHGVHRHPAPPGHGRRQRCGRLPADDRQAGRLPGTLGRPRDRRDRPGVPGHLELVGVQRRRPGARLRGRCRTHRHGVRPVPSDRDGLAARRPRPPRHRGGPGRGRHPPQQRGRALHVASTCPRTGGPSTPRPTRRPPAG